MPGISDAQPQVPTMTKQEIRVGTVSNEADYRRIVRFNGAELAHIRTFAGARNRDDRGCDYTLYAVPGGHRVHILEWSRWQGETNDSSLTAVIPLARVQGLYPALANEAGLPTVLDLDEDPAALDEDSEGWDEPLADAP